MSQRPNREICFLCENRPGAGGMENYLARLSKELEHRGQPHRVIHNPVPRKISHLFRVLFYNFWVCFIKRNLDKVRDFSIAENADRTLELIRRVMEEKRLSSRR